MEEGVVRMAAGMYAYVADMEAVKARIKAMETCNTGRDEPLYNEEHFFHAEQELECIAKALREKYNIVISGSNEPHKTLTKKGELKC